jgi:CHASE2 domain-containing sensor protein
LVLGISAALGSWVLHQAGWLSPWDGVFYDRFLSLTAPWREFKPKVLLLRTARGGGWSDADAINTITTLENLGARLIAIDSAPTGNSREFFQRAAESKRVVLGRELRPAPENPDSLRLEPWPKAAEGLDLPWGVVFLPPSLRGIHRWQQTIVTAGRDELPTLEGRIAALFNPIRSPRLRSGPFLINFVGEPGSIPNATLAQALGGDLIPEMVRGKVVLVGSHDGLFGLETPVSGGANPMSFLEFQGNALQTLLDAAPMTPLAGRWALLLMIGLGVLSSLVYQRVNSVAGARLAVGVLAVCGLGTLVSLWLFRLWLPLGAMVLAQTGQYALTLVFRTRMTNRALNEMRLRALNQIKERFFPPDVMSSPEHWDHLASMINQTLDIGRMVFLERVPQTQRLVGIKAVNCRLEDLQEKERTLEAAAFAPVLAKGSPVRVTGFFKQSPTPEIEYLCPLLLAGELFGIWGLSMDAAKAEAIPQLEGVLQKFSQQIARVNRLRHQVAPKKSLWARLRVWVSAEKDDQAYRELNRTADLLEQYGDVLEAVLSQIGTAMIVYDFFGRVLKANEPALALLRAENFAAGRGTALEFLKLVTGMEESQVRRLLRNVLLEGTPSSLSVKLASQKDRHYLLRIFPLSQPNQSPPARSLFGVRGLVCELIETTSLSTLVSLKGVVADRLGVELRDHLAAIQMSAALLEVDHLPEPERRSVLEAIHSKTKICVQVISECQKYLGRHVDAYTLDCFPLDALEVLGEVCPVIAARAAERRITLRMEQPRLMDQVLASTTELAEIFTTTLGLLLKDAVENSVLTIEVEDASDTSVFRFSNSGFGIPNDRLQQALTSSENPASEEFRSLRAALAWVNNWGGSLKVTSDVGVGYSVVLRLRQFKLTSLLPPNSP